MWLLLLLILAGKEPDSLNECIWYLLRTPLPIPSLLLAVEVIIEMHWSIDLLTLLNPRLESERLQYRPRRKHNNEYLLVYKVTPIYKYRITRYFAVDADNNTQ